MKSKIEWYQRLDCVSKEGPIAALGNLQGVFLLKLARGGACGSSSNVITSVAMSCFSRTLSIYCRSPKNLEKPKFRRGLDGLGWCSTVEGFSGVLSSWIGLFPCEVFGRFEPERCTSGPLGCLSVESEDSPPVALI